VALPAVRERFARLAVETMMSTPNLIMTMAKAGNSTMGRGDQASRRQDRMNATDPSHRNAGRIVFRGAELIDGTGRPRFEADVVVEDGRIAELCAPGAATGGEHIDAQGMVLCPGFIDTHSHDDLLVLDHPSPHPKLSQGVCTVVTGNCGISLAPLVIDRAPPPMDLFPPGVFRHARFSSYVAELDAARPAVNVVPLVGHTSLRIRHMASLERAATPEETAAMRTDVEAALQAGAFGLSTGVYYPPARAATTDELVRVSTPLRARRAVLAMHIRDEGDSIDAAIDEALLIGAASGAQLVLSHHKVVGAQNHGRTRQTLHTLEAAASQQAVCIDCYPYEASSTMLDPERASRVGEVLVTWSQAEPAQGGRRLKDIAADWGVELKQAAERLLPGGAIYFAMAAEDVERVLMHPLTMIGSDGLPHDAHPHPRLWGSFPRVLGHYARDRGLLPLERAVHKMTGLPASRFGLAGRGTIAPGQAADLVLLDPATVRDTATYERPLSAAAGIALVMVNGRIAVRDGEHLDLHAGRRLLPAWASA
jgi:N-acyl-D-amino-acid deacylase